MSHTKKLETDRDPETQAEHMIDQLGGPFSARAAAMRYKQAATNNARRAYWSAVVQWIDHGEGC